jgi:hypothetical protein
VIGAVLAVGALVLPGTPVGLPIPDTAFGLHVNGIVQTAPEPGVLTSVRLWDAGVRWDEVEPARGQYRWDDLDAAVANAEASGATDILYVLGSTPRWAARNPDEPGLYGPGTTSLPAQTSDFVDFTRQVAKRYEGRITAYQIWNEANTRSFYEGDWVALAKLTRRAYDTVKLVDPNALVVGASSTVIPGKLFQTESFFVRYARAIHAAGDPVDAMAVHLYPVDTSKGPEARVGSIRAAQRVMNRVGIDRPLWDTEVSYGDRRPGLPQVVPDPQTAATYVARTYVDSVRLGIERTYWYGWDSHVLGIDLTDDSGVTPAGTAFLTVRDWLTGARLAGCTDHDQLTVCRFADAEGRAFSILWSAAGTVQVSGGGLRLCRIDGSCAKAPDDLAVDSEPVLLTQTGSGG